MSTTRWRTYGHRAEAAENALVHRREEDYRAGFAAGLMAYREELGLPAIGAIEAAAAAANAKTPFDDDGPRAGGGNEGNAVGRSHGSRRRGVHGDGGGYPERVVVQLGRGFGRGHTRRRARGEWRSAADAPGRSSSLTPAGAAALARAHERRSLSRSQSLEKGAAADAAANALGGLELFEVPLGE